MKSVTENVIADVLGQEHLHAIIKQVEENVKDDIPHRHKSPH